MIEKHGYSPEFADSLINSFMEMLNEAPEDGSMDDALGDVLSVGSKFEHEYDFGSTTELVLKVVAEREGVTPKVTKKPNPLVTILARNDAPELACLKCGKPATKICLECEYPDGGAYCDKCAGKECPGCDE